MHATTLINIGNTNIEFTVWDGQCIGDVQCLQTAQILHDVSVLDGYCRPKNRPIVIACVVPEARKRFEHHFDADHLIWLSSDHELGLDFSLVDRRTIGADRLANAVAACCEPQLPVIVLDCGTAITVDIVDSRRRFLGGSIMPGRQLLRTALANGTGQLPMVGFAENLPQPIGTTTADAIRSGLDLGVIGAVQRVLDDSRGVLASPSIPVIVVGGDREYFARHLANVRRGPDSFTLLGLGRVANRLVEYQNSLVMTR